MRRMLLMFVTLILLGGCSVADDGPLERLIADRFIHDELRRWAMRRAAISEVTKAVRDAGNDRLRIAHMECREKTGRKWGEWAEEVQEEVPPAPGENPDDFTGGNILDVLARDMLHDLIGDKMLNEGGETYPEIVDGLDQRAMDRAAKKTVQSGRQTQCRYVYLPGFAPDEMPHTAMDPTEEEIEKELLRAPQVEIPPVIVAAIAAIAGAAVGVPVLCPLENGAPCPSDPRYPPGQTPEPPDAP